MQIAYIIYSMSGTGGMERITSVKANWLVSNGHQVDVIVTDQQQPFSGFPLDERVGFICMGLDLSGNSKKTLVRRVYDRSFRLPSSYKKALSAILTEKKYDIVVSMVPYYHKETVSIKDGSKKVFETHFSYYDPFIVTFPKYPPMIKQLSILYYKYTSRQLRYYDAVGVLTQEDALARRLPNSVVIGNPPGFETDAWADYGSKKVIAVGRYVYTKGFDLLLEAWKQLWNEFPDWRLEIYGKKADQYDRLREFVAQNGLERRVALCDAVPDIREKYLSGSVFVLSSRVEGFPMALCEAMECGLPCVSFACKTGPKEIVINGENGLLVDQLADPQALAQGMRVLMRDRTVREKMGRKAKVFISKNYSSDIIMNKWLSCYHSLLK